MSQTPFHPDTGPSAGAGGRADEPNDRPTGDAGRAQRVAGAARRWQRELADLGGRNTLLWYQDLPSGTLDLTTAHPGGVSMLMAGRGARLSDLVREPSAFAEARRRAHVIRAKVREMHEERGLVSGFMAIGMATWNAPGSRRAPQAPVLLRVCRLRPTDPAHRDYDLDLDGRVELNPVLVHYLASEQGIHVDPDAISDIAYIAHRFDPMPAFRELGRICRSVPGFRIVDRRVLGTFSYAKLPMVADLSAVAGDLAGHDVVAALAGEASLPEPAAPRPGADPGDGLACVDADDAQQGVVDAVRAGTDVAVTGPPGSGRTQTVAALVAGLVADGKRVLVVSQKRTPLTDLHERLETAGLGGLVVDLPHGALDHGAVARAVEESLDFGWRTAQPDLSDIEASLVRYRDRLEGHREAVHEARIPWGVSVWEAHDALTRLGRGRRPPSSPVRLTGSVFEGLDADRREHAGSLLENAASHGAWSESLEKDPWARARIVDEGERARAEKLVAELDGSRLEDERAHLDGVLSRVGLQPARTVAGWGEALDLLEGVRRTLESFDPAVYGGTLTEYVGATGTGGFRKERGIRQAWWTRWGLRREARSHVLPEARVGDLHGSLREVADQRAGWDRLSGGASSPRLSEGLEEARGRYDALAADLTWLGERLATTAAGGDLLDEPLPDLRSRLHVLASRRDRLAVLPEVTPLLDELDGLGLTPLVDDLAARRVAPEQVVAENDHVWWNSVLAAVAAADERIGSHDGQELRTVLEEYTRLDREFLAAGPERVRAQVAAGLAPARAADTDGVRLVRAEAARDTHHLPVRELVARSGRLLTAARPVWLMSPLVVASVLPPGRHFDVLVVEDAARTEPAQIVSAAARCERIVLVGDDGHLDPAPFLVAAADAEQAELDDLVPTAPRASVLDALGLRLQRHRLIADHRSEDERLVAFVETHLRGGRLITYPGTGAERPVDLVAVGTDDAPEGEAPPEPVDLEAREVERVVRLVIDHARHRPEQSLGVVTLDPGRARRVRSALRDALDREHGGGLFEFFDEDAREPFFVEPLDRVQGDVRDCIVLTIGHAPGGDGRGILARLGPLNLEGGEGRLGVALSTARSRLLVVTSLTPESLGAGHLSSRGALLLRHLIEYAAAGGDPAVLRRQVRGGSGAAPTPSAPEADAQLDEFAVRLRQEGLVVHERYGVSGRTVDLAVEDPHVPGRMAVAIESDGRAYAARTRTRDRERLRADRLVGLGWGHVRVFGHDLAADPAPDVARVLDAVRRTDATRRSAWRGAPGRSVGDTDATW